MAKKRASGKLRNNMGGTDDGKDEYFMRDGKAYVRSGQSGDTFGPYDRNSLAGQRARNVPPAVGGNKLGRPTPPSSSNVARPKPTYPQGSKTFLRPESPRGPKPPVLSRTVSGKDALAGRTADFGTRSLLEGMKSWMRGGGLRRGSM